jgi:hypothetical protein
LALVGGGGGSGSVCTAQADSKHKLCQSNTAGCRLGSRLGRIANSTTHECSLPTADKNAKAGIMLADMHDARSHCYACTAQRNPSRVVVVGLERWSGTDNIDFKVEQTHG